MSFLLFALLIKSHNNKRYNFSLRKSTNVSRNWEFLLFFLFRWFCSNFMSEWLSIKSCHWNRISFYFVLSFYHSFFSFTLIRLDIFHWQNTSNARTYSWFPLYHLQWYIQWKMKWKKSFCENIMSCQQLNEKQIGNS